MRTLFSFRFLYLIVALLCTIVGRALSAESLRLTAGSQRPYSQLSDKEAPGFSVEVLRRVFATIGQDVSFETIPWERSWLMLARGEIDGMFPMLRAKERERICSFSDEPLAEGKWVMFIRSDDLGRLNFSSFDDLVGHDVGVHRVLPSLFEQPTGSYLELWKFLREQHNMVETDGGLSSLRLLAAGRVDYVYTNLATGMSYISLLGLSGKIQPLLSGRVVEDGMYLCFSKTRVDPALVDAFSRALKQFKQTDDFRSIYHRYFP